MYITKEEVEVSFEEGSFGEGIDNFVGINKQIKEGTFASTT